MLPKWYKVAAMIEGFPEVDLDPVENFVLKYEPAMVEVDEYGTMTIINSKADEEWRNDLLKAFEFYKKHY